MENKRNKNNKNNNAIQAERIVEGDYIETWNMIEEMENIQKFDTDGAWAKMRGKLEDEQLIPDQKEKIKKLNIKSYYWIAASLALLISIGIVNQLVKKDTTQYFANNTHEVLTCELNDGSKVYLNGGAELMVSKGFNNVNRQVELIGEAFFDVARNEALPFEVLVKDAAVKVLGTSFNIRSSSSSSKVEVLVKTGKVALSHIAKPNRNIALLPNQKGVLENETLFMEQAKASNYMAWKDKALEFKRAPLEVVIDDISRAYQVDINVDAALSDSLTITATYYELSIDELMESICMTMNLDFEKQGDSFTLK